MSIFVDKSSHTSLIVSLGEIPTSRIAGPKNKHFFAKVFLKSESSAPASLPSSKLTPVYWRTPHGCSLVSTSTPDSVCLKLRSSPKKLAPPSVFSPLVELPSPKLPDLRVASPPIPVPRVLPPCPCLFTSVSSSTFSGYYLRPDPPSSLPRQLPTLPPCPPICPPLCPHLIMPVTTRLKTVPQTASSYLLAFTIHHFCTSSSRHKRLFKSLQRSPFSHAPPAQTKSVAPL